MAGFEEQYSLEEILAEFKPSGEPVKAKQTAEAVPPAAKSAPKKEETLLSDAEMREQEAAFTARLRERQKQQKKPEKDGVDDTILATISQIKKENDAVPVSERQTDPGQITMKFPAVKEMAKKAEEGPKKPEEVKPEPLNFTAFTKREVPPPRKAPPKPTEEDKLRNRTSAPWRTSAEGGQTKEQQTAEEKAPPRLRTIDLTTGQAKLELPPDPETFDPEEPEKPRKPKKRLSYDRVNRPVDDTAQMAAKLGRRLSGMAARLLLFFPVIVTSLYVTLAITRGFPMPAGFTYEAYPQYYMGIFALCQLLTLLLCSESTVAGFWRLFHGKPTLDTVLTLSGLASLAYCGVAAFLPEWRMGCPYVSVTAVTGFFALLSKRQRYEALRRNYKAMTMGTAPSGVKLYSDGKAQNLAVKTQSGVDIPLKNLSYPDFTETYACYYSPVVIVLAVALAMSASVMKGETGCFLWSLSAVMAVTAPMGLLLSSSASGKRLGKKLYTSGSMLVNAQSAGRLAKSHAAVLRDSDLYPAGSVKITGMKIAENQEPEMVVGCAAALLQEVGGGLSKAFLEFARQMYIVPNKAKELRFFDTRGIAATVSGKYVQLGTASYLMRMGIRVTEGLKLKDSIFIAIDSQFAGIFSIRYTVQTPVYGAFGLFRHSRIRPVLALRDTNQTQNAVEARFELKRDTTYQPDLEERLRYSASSFGKEEETLALLSRDGLMPFAEVLTAAKKWRKAARQGCLLGTICALFGMFVLAFLTGEGAFAAADPVNVLLYLLLWSLPCKLLRGIVTRL